MNSRWSAVVVVVALAVAPSSAFASIIIIGDGTLNLLFGRDTDNLDGTPYSFSYTIPDGTTWTAIGGGFGFGAQVSSPSITLNGTSVTFNAGELPLFATNNGALAGLADATHNAVLNFSVFGDSDVFMGAALFAPPSSVPASAGAPVLPGQLSQRTETYLGQIQSLNGSTYFTVPTSLSITGSTVPSVPEPATVFLLGTGLVGLVRSARRRGRY